MKVLVLGGSGMLGHVVAKYLRQQEFTVLAPTRQELDLESTDSITGYILMNKPDVIINCAGILNRDINYDLYARLNIMLPKILADNAEMLRYKLINVSTNCVFKDLGPHKESEAPNAIDLYGISKAMGEVNDDHNLTIRCSITGPETRSSGTGLFHWFTTNDQSSIHGYKKALWNGVTTLQLAKFIEECIDDEIVGLINYYTEKTENKADVLKIINDVYGLGKTIVPVDKQAHASLLEGLYFTKKTLHKQFEEMRDWYK